MKNRTQTYYDLQDAWNACKIKFQNGDYVVKEFDHYLIDLPAGHKMPENETFDAIATYFLWCWSTEHNDYRFEQFFNSVNIPNLLHIDLYGYTIIDIVNTLNNNKLEAS